MSTRPNFDPQAVVLENGHVRLEPLAPHHADELYRAGSEEDTWRYLPRSVFVDLDDTRGWIEDTMRLVDLGGDLAFATISQASGEVVGTTRYLDIRRANRGLEIGWTWLGSAARRTAINTSCKYLLLSHAFDSLGAIRVQLKTDSRNSRSQEAIKRIGAQYEGILRNHIIMADGYYRDTAMFSITDSEWPEVKQHLADMLKGDE